MPYDLTLNAKGAGPKEVGYTILRRTPTSALTATELELAAKAGKAATSPRGC